MVTINNFDEHKNKGKVIPLFGRQTNPHDIPFPTQQELDALSETIKETVYPRQTLYEVVEECMEDVETYQTKKGVVVVVPIDDMDACIEEIMDASQKLEEYEQALKQISERESELGSKIAKNVLQKYE